MACKAKIENILGFATFISLFLPLICLNHHHNCMHDECMYIYCNGRLGLCVEDAIDDMFLTIAILWWFAVYGGGIILNKRRNAVSPFVIMGLLIGQAVFGAFMDPGKWGFVIALSVSAMFFIISVTVDGKNKAKWSNIKNESRN